MGGISQLWKKQIQFLRDSLNFLKIINDVFRIEIMYSSH